MLKWILLLSLFCAVSCESFRLQRQPSSDEPQKPSYIIFTVHGLSGSEKTFGAMKATLENRLNAISTKFNYRVVTVTYPTGDKAMNTYHFSQILGAKIQDELKNEKHPDTKIAIISHSQGGIISWIWYLRSYMGFDDYLKYQPAALRLDAFITLGSPLWGSKLANIAYESATGKTLAKMAHSLGMKLGRSELAEMAHGSDTIYRFHKRAIQADGQGLQLPMRPLAIAGVFPKSQSQKVSQLSLKYQAALKAAESLLGYGAGYRLETDLAVQLPNARFTFFYNQNPQPGSVPKFDDFRLFSDQRLDQLVILETVHLSWDQASFYDMAEVPEQCVREVCTHPTLPYILMHIADCDNQACDPEGQSWALNSLFNSQMLGRHRPADLKPENLMSFVVDLNLVVPEAFVRVGAIQPYSLSQSIRFGNSPESQYQIFVAQQMEPVSAIHKLTEFTNIFDQNQKEQHARVIVTGYVLRQKGISDEEYQKLYQRGFRLPVDIRLPGLAVKKFTIKVRPTYSTFVELKY